MKHISKIQIEFLSILKNGQKQFFKVYASVSKTTSSNQYKPIFFGQTWYRPPTDHELTELNSWHLAADEIYIGFCYSIVGRGMMRRNEKDLINESISRLSKMFPYNREYTKALEKVKNIHIRG